jgi:hypothetical protein
MASQPITSSRWIALGLVAAGVALHFYIEGFKQVSALSEFSLGSFLYSCAPYVLVTLVILFARTPFPGLVGGAAALTIDLMTYWSVFISPTSSNVGLALLWMPLWNLLIFVPLGIGVGWLIYSLSDAK